MSKSNQYVEPIDSSDEASLGDILYKFLPFWPLFVILIIIGLSGAWVYLRYKQPIYQTTATILIKDDQKSGKIDPLEAFDMFGGKKSVENEVEILKSKTLMQEVVKNLHLYAPVEAKGRVSTVNAYLSFPVIVDVKAPDSIKNVLNIPISYNKNNQLVTLGKNQYPLNQFLPTPFGNLKFIQNQNYRSVLIKENNEVEDIHYVFSLQSVQKAANGLLTQLTVSPSSKLSSVINIGIQGEVPKRNEDIINELLKVYNQAAILDKNILAANTLKFVENRLDFVENDLDSVEGSLQRFKANNKIVDISSQGQIFLETVAANDQKISDINIQLAMLDQVQNYVNSEGGIGGIVPSTLGVSDPALTSLLKNLGDLELKYEQIKKIVPENNPAVVSIVDGIGKLKPGIQENINSQRKNLLAARNNLNSTNNRFSSMLKNIPEKERELLGISRQQSIKNNIYTFLLQKREETALSFASAVADSRIIDKAQTSSAPDSPNRNKVYLTSIILALFLGIGFVVLKDLLTRTVQSKSDVEKSTDVPFLGEIVFDRSKAAIVIGEGKRTFIAEQFRQMRTALSYLGIDETHKRILITSSISGEGKSFIAINIGISLSLTGKKVALLEMDLRKPKISEEFNISRMHGITNYLVGKQTAKEITKETGFANLFLLPSGPIPPNPSELISNGRLEELLNELETKFDFIIIDTAPTNPVTDAFLVSPLADVTLYVVRHDYTPKIFLPKLQVFKDENRLKNMGLVYNGVRGKGISKYGYGNEYGYGYGYTEEDSTNKWWNIFKRK